MKNKDTIIIKHLFNETIDKIKKCLLNIYQQHILILL